MIVQIKNHHKFGQVDDCACMEISRIFCWAKKIDKWEDYGCMDQCCSLYGVQNMCRQIGHNIDIIYD